MVFRRRHLWRAIPLGAFVVASCGGSGEVMTSVDDGLPMQQAPLDAPSVRLVSPWEWQAGDVVTVIGSDFVEPVRGHTVIRFDGEFVEEGGESRRVDMSVRATYRTAGKVDFVFEPAFPPGGFGHSLGTFEGDVTATNRDDEASSPPSAALAAEVEVGPSLIIWQLWPGDDDCNQRPRIDSTVDGQGLRLELEAIGLTPATSYTPLEYTVSFVDFAGQPRLFTERIVSGTRAHLEVEVGSLPYGTVSGTLFVGLEVRDGHGSELSRSAPVNFALEHTASYDGNVRTAELYSPVQVSACMPGGPYGRSVSFSAGDSESRGRSVSLSANVGINIWVLNVGFGINVSDSVSSGTSTGLSMSGNILPNQFGVFYRQTQRLERLGKIIHRAACGDTSVVGDARVTDWNWAPDLAVTQNGICPPAPPSNLPPAQVFP